MRRIALLAAGLAALLAASMAGAATLVVEPATPVRGETTAIRIARDDSSDDASRWKVYVEYFPNSKVIRDDTLGVTGPAGEIFWKPTFAGIVAVRAIRQAPDGSAEQLAANVSVKYPAVPVGGVLVFFAAGTILLGGAGWAFVHLLEHKPPGEA